MRGRRGLCRGELGVGWAGVSVTPLTRTVLRVQSWVENSADTTRAMGK